VGHGSARGPFVSDGGFAKYVARKHAAAVGGLAGPAKGLHGSERWTCVAAARCGVLRLWGSVASALGVHENCMARWSHRTSTEGL
jgi:hypothetical protein